MSPYLKEKVYSLRKELGETETQIKQSVIESKRVGKELYEGEPHKRKKPSHCPMCQGEDTLYWIAPFERYYCRICQTYLSV